MHNKVCVVIPVYKAFGKLDKTELISWQQCLRVLGEHPIYLICARSFAAVDYIEDAKLLGITCQQVAFAPEFFSSIDGYNRLMISRHFYKSFERHEYMLLYQLDAFVFKDELDLWCSKGYSYVGAPWFENYQPADENAKLWQVGNGGFTLRNVADCLRVLSSFGTARSWPAIVQDHFPVTKPGVIKRIHLFTKYWIFGNNTHWLVNDFHRYRTIHQEDYFWGVVCKEKFSWYKVPSPQQALPFSFEVSPSTLYNLNGKQLPMGCHAWEKQEPFFWKPFIEAFGYKL